jgi:hypothetical protein
VRGRQTSNIGGEVGPPLISHEVWMRYRYLDRNEITGWSWNVQSPTKSLSECTLLVVVFALAIWGLIDASSRLLHWSKANLNGGTPHCWCGTSDEEAMTMGCRYDHLAVDWLPQSCIDDELVKEFDRSGPGPDGT